MLSKLIIQQKIAARKNIVKLSMINVDNKEVSSKLNSAIEYEKLFLNSDFTTVSSISDLYNLYKNTRLISLISIGELPINLPGAPAQNSDINPDEDVKPMFGNLLAVLEKEVYDELVRMNNMRVPSPNDLRRWALKDAVLNYYKSMNLPANTEIVETSFDDRLLPKLAPNYNTIYNMWMERLYNLTRRNNDDKYRIESSEYDEAEKDIYDNNGMRGTAFEKQLDRYREEFMQKIKR